MLTQDLATHMDSSDSAVTKNLICWCNYIAPYRTGGNIQRYIIASLWREKTFFFFFLSLSFFLSSKSIFLSINHFSFLLTFLSSYFFLFFPLNQSFFFLPFFLLLASVHNCLLMCDECSQYVYV